MKNKKLLYVLIPATLILWGMIVYKIVGVVNNGHNNTEMTTIISNGSNETINDTFSIHPDEYRDPFLKKIKKKTVSVNPIPNKIKPVVQAITVQWPSIAYGGTIKNQKSSKELALVQINGQSNIMKSGEKINEVQLTKIFRDSIEVIFGKEKKIIKKQ